MSNNLNYKPLIEEKIQEFFKQHPSYTYGDLLYSIWASMKGKRVEKKVDLRDVTDSEFYTALDMAIKREKNDDDEQN